MSDLKTWQCPCCKTVYTEAVTSCECAKAAVKGEPYPVYVPYVPVDTWPYRGWGTDPVWVWNPQSATYTTSTISTMNAPNTSVTTKAPDCFHYTGSN